MAGLLKTGKPVESLSAVWLRGLSCIAGCKVRARKKPVFTGNTKDDRIVSILSSFFGRGVDTEPFEKPRNCNGYRLPISCVYIKIRLEFVTCTCIVAKKWRDVKGPKPLKLGSTDRVES